MKERNASFQFFSNEKKKTKAKTEKIYSILLPLVEFFS